jgi:hypothetical protein
MTDTWEPGVPLYPRPTERNHGDGCYIRHLFDLVSDEETAEWHMLHSPVVVEVVCTHCLVGWPPDEGPNCWVCDKPADNYDMALEADVAARELYGATAAYLRGGPAVGNVYSVEWNDPPDSDHVYATVTRVGTVFQVNRLNDPRLTTVLHRWRRTDEWSNRHRAYVFVYEGEVTPDA